MLTQVQLRLLPATKRCSISGLPKDRDARFWFASSPGQRLALERRPTKSSPLVTQGPPDAKPITVEFFYTSRTGMGGRARARWTSPWLGARL